MGRSATGVRGTEGDKVVGASVVTDQDEVLIITEWYSVQWLANTQPKAVAVKELPQPISQRKWSLGWSFNLLKEMQKTDDHY